MTNFQQGGQNFDSFVQMNKFGIIFTQNLQMNAAKSLQTKNTFSSRYIIRRKTKIE